MSIFSSLSHIIIVFHPGSSGNFLSELFGKILSNNLTNISISKVGSSHNVDVIPQITFGVHTREHLRFENEDRRIEYYLKFIKNYPIHRRHVIITHDFTNIPIYRKYYPNAKILTITLNSPVEKFIATFFQIEKTIMDPNFKPIFPKKMWESMVNYWIEKYYQYLTKEIGYTLSKKIIENRYDDVYKNLILYTSMNIMIDIYNLQPLFNNDNDQDFINFVQDYKRDKDSIIKSIGDHYSKFVDENCIAVPFNIIVNCESEEMIKIIEFVLEIELSENQKKFVTENMYSFAKKQNQAIIKDPIEFYNTIKKEAIDYFNTLKIL